MRAIEKKLKDVLDSRKNERLSKKRIAEIIKEFSAKTVKPTDYVRPTIDGLTLNLLRRSDGITND
jgi:hypothetical protein